VKPAALVSSELQVIKKKNPVLQINIAPKAAQKELTVQSTTDKELVPTAEQLQGKHFVTPQDIEKEKLPPEEILSLPMFKVHKLWLPSLVIHQFGII
jgi:U11/U12 small nuclear ribonucleoprotein SNRNP65